VKALVIRWSGKRNTECAVQNSFASAIKISPTGEGAPMGQIQFSIKHVRTENYRIYYRVFVDGVELPSMVCIFTSQKTKNSDEELKTWCADNAWRLETGAIVHVDLTALSQKKTGRGA
jgi:hypothetical protein